MSKTIAVICGGPSAERGISLNSARSVMDHLSSAGLIILPFYVDKNKNFYSISRSQLYSNTPSDFDFKLQSSAQKLTEDEFIVSLKEADIVFPAIHGAYGEDGELQAFLEKHSIPYIGVSSTTCELMFHKNKAAQTLRENGFPTITSLLISPDDEDWKTKLQRFFEMRNLERAVVKPDAGGSSLGVSSVANYEDAFEKAQTLIDQKICSHVLVEPFCEGREFTIIVIEDDDGNPLPLIPTEIQINYDGGQLFDYRRKYLPTSNTKWLCPPSFDESITKKIRSYVVDIFKLFKMRDFARIDGWVLDDGQILFTDFNPISGMEQNSFIFQQASRVGLSHSDILQHVIQTALKRYDISFEAASQPANENKKPVFVLFGGDTAERHVSVMSGTNVWLKLKASHKYEPAPFFLDQNGCVWALSYTYALKHTTEEIFEDCQNSADIQSRSKTYIKDIACNLKLVSESEGNLSLPQKHSLEEFLNLAQEKSAFVFLGLHGGKGEDGTLQSQLSDLNIPHNGSGAAGARLCMNKAETGERIMALNDEAIISAGKKKVSLDDLTSLADNELSDFWNNLKLELKSDTFIIKPQNDGCSAGIVRLNKFEDLTNYVRFVESGSAYASPGTFSAHDTIIEMPSQSEKDFLIEEFIETDIIEIRDNDLFYQDISGWLELTVGVLESGGNYQSLDPSITVADGAVLTLEEKFQGGTGINITPPPDDIVSPTQLDVIKSGIERVARQLNIENYARIDIFFNRKTNQILVIEANTLPGLTPSTVIFHQALAQNPPLYPTAFLEKIIDLKLNASCPKEVQNEVLSSQNAPARASVS
ncbi:MAG: hypothetical protein AAF569_03640 [Pseudomonadota bacterium]